jgi:hypothetical protein
MERKLRRGVRDRMREAPMQEYAVRNNQEARE